MSFVPTRLSVSLELTLWYSTLSKVPVSLAPSVSIDCLSLARGILPAAVYKNCGSPQHVFMEDCTSSSPSLAPGQTLYIVTVKHVMTAVSPTPAASYQWRSESRHEMRSDSRASTIPDPVERNVARWRSESRSSNRAFKNEEEPSQQEEIVAGTLSALKEDVEQTTEIIRRKQEQWRMEKKMFQTDMEVTGRISVDPSDDWLSARLRAVSADEMNSNLGKVKKDQEKNAVTDTLAALVYDVNATAEVLRRASLERRRKEDRDREQKTEIEYRLRLTPAPDEFPAPRPRPPVEQNYNINEMDYGVEVSEQQTESMRRRRARSETPRRTLQIEGEPPAAPPSVCAYCSEEIDGPILTALAPNSDRAQKFHSYHFMCTYCQKALNMHGTYREHDKKPYCHNCFYKLYSGLQFQPDEHQAGIDKLI